MCIGYDPFTWADNFTSEEEYLKELIADKKRNLKMENKVTIDLDAITFEMDELKKEKARLDFELKQVKDEIEKRELQLTALMSRLNVNEMNHGVYSWGIKEVTRTALDQKLLKEQYPEQYNACYVQKVSEKFEFKINK